MREFLLLGLIGALCAVSLASPRLGVLSYVWFSLMRPDFIAWSSGRFNYSAYLAIAVMLGSWRLYPNIFQSWLRNPFPVLFVLLHIPVGISVVTAFNPQFSYEMYWQFVRMSVMALWIPLVMTTLEDFRKLFLVTAFSLGLYGFWYGSTGVLHGGARIWTGIGGSMGDNNTMGVGLAMVIPLCWFGRNLVRSKLMRLALVGMIFCSMAAIVLTYSRGAAVAMAVVVLLIAYRSRQKALVLAALALCIVPTVYLVSERYFDRMATLANVEEEESAYSRVEQAILSVRMWKDNPFFGVGMGDQNYIEQTGRYAGQPQRNIVHNSFLQMLVHCGIFAFLIYAAMFCGAIWWLGQSAKRIKASHPGLEAYPIALQISLISFVVSSMVHPRAIFDFSYMLVMYTAAWYAIERDLRAAVQAPQPRMSAAPPVTIGLPIPAWMPMLRRSSLVRWAEQRRHPRAGI